MNKNKCNNKPSLTSVSTVAKKGFTLVELMIVVSILGILAAIVFPQFQGHIQKAKESAAKDNLRVLREAIERYAAEHNGVPPGYTGDDNTTTPSELMLKIQLTNNKTYLSDIPKNPFSNLNSVMVYNNGSTISNVPFMTDVYGWIYQPATDTIKLNSTGSDSEGKSYYSY